jgi:hypothetical protein
MIGTPATFALLAAGLVGADRLRRRSRPLADGELAGMARRLADTLGIVRPVALGVCDRLAAPILLGVVRPLVLLPAAVAGWSPEQIEMALLHELAHVRRLDNLVNLVQRVIESLLFFHPAVWWISGWVRLEREHCCDRLVVARTGRARPYAELLAELALYRDRPGRAAVAMAESPVVARIRCILNMEDHLMPLSRPVIALAAVVLAAPAVLIASQAGAPGPEGGGTKQPKAAKAPEQPDRARIEEFLRRTRHGADMFQGVQDRAYTLTQIAGVQARSGDREAARRTFRQAEELAGSVSIDDSTYWSHVLLWIIRAEARHGFHDEAVASAHKLLRIAEAPTRRESQKVDLYRYLIEIQKELGDRAGVQETFQTGRKFFLKSADPLLVTYGPAFIVSIQAISGDLIGALRMVRDPELYRRVRPENVANIRHDALFNVVAAIKPDNRDGAGQVLEEALRTVATYKNPSPWGSMVIRHQDLQNIASAQARLGLFDEALKTARMIDTETIPDRLSEPKRAEYLDEQRVKKAETLAGIGLEQAKSGDRAGARRSAEEAARIAGTIQISKLQSNPLWQTAEALVKVGDLAEARRLVDAMPSDLRIKVYGSIAEAQRDAGGAAGARATLRTALDLARRRLDEFDAANHDRKEPIGAERNRLLEGLARLQAKLGDRKEAIETSRWINNGGQQNEALERIATDLAADGDLDGALEVIGQINSPQSEADALKAVASAFSRRAESPPAR